MFSTFSSSSSVICKNIKRASFGTIWTQLTTVAGQGYSSGSLYNYAFTSCIRTSNDGTYILVLDEPDKKVFLSTNSGSTWTSLTTVQGFQTTKSTRGCCMSSDGSIMYLATTNGQVYKSSDYGTNWATVSGTSYNAYGMCCSNDGQNVLLNSYGADCFYSTNGGTTFTSLSGKGITTSQVSNVAISADGTKWIVLVSGYSGTGTNRGVWYSSNSGSTFTNLYSNTGIQFYEPFVNNNGDIFVTVNVDANTTYGGFIYTQSNSTWTGVSTSVTGANAICYTGGASSDLSLLVLANRQSTGSNDYIHFSKDMGSTWSRAITLGRSTWQSSAVSPDGKNIYASGVSALGNLYKSS